MITVHHLNQSRSQRVLWLLEELDLPYEVVQYARDPATRLAPPALKAVHPLGKSPVITDAGLTLAESGAIIEYLVQTYGDGRLQPSAGSPERLRYLYWMHYAEGSLMPLLVMKLVMSRMGKAPAVPEAARPLANQLAEGAVQGFVQPNIERQLGFVESELGGSEWFAGSEFSAADIQMSFPLEAAEARAGIEAYPKIQAFLARIRARPAYQRAIERGGPFDLLR